MKDYNLGKGPMPPISSIPGFSMLFKLMTNLLNHHHTFWILAILSLLCTLALQYYRPSNLRLGLNPWIVNWLGGSC